MSVPPPVPLINRAAPVTIGVGPAPTGIAVRPDGLRVYVANSGDGTLSVVDSSTPSGTVVATVGVGSAPWVVAMSPVGPRAYVSNTGSGTVSVIDTVTDTVAATITGFAQPRGLSVGASGSELYVANSGTGTIGVVDTATNSTVTTIGVGSSPDAVAVRTDLLRAYVSNAASGTVSVINTATRTTVATIGGFTQPRGLAVNPAGTELYVADPATRLVSVVNTATNAVVETIDLATSPWYLAASPDGTLLYATKTGDGALAAINTASRLPTNHITGFAGPLRVATSPDGRRLYVTNNAAATVTTLRRPASLTPNESSHASGTTVTIRGEGFTGTTVVRFGSRRAKSFAVLGDTTLTAVTPAIRGAAPVTVTASGGTAPVGRFYSRNIPVIDTYSVAQGPRTGGNALTLTGKWLSAITEVRFGGTTVTPIIVSDQEITVTVPPAAVAGDVPLFVTGIGGVSNSGQYTYLGGPVITSISPTSGPRTGSRPLNINGTGLATVNGVTIGGAVAPFAVTSDIKVRAITPPGAPGPAAVVVTTASGQTTISPTPYTYT